jgi:ferredoxin--NADP+ reductase
MKLLIEDLEDAKPKKELSSLLSSRGVVHLSQGQWEKINAAEVSAGEVVGKPRLKFTKREEMLGLQ